MSGVLNVQTADEGLYTLWITNSLYATASWSAGVGLTTPILLSGPTVRSDGIFRFQLEGIAWQNYQIQFSTNLPTLTNWLPLTMFSYTTGRTPVEDIAPTNTPRRFYRAVLRP